MTTTVEAVQTGPDDGQFEAVMTDMSDFAELASQVSADYVMPPAEMPMPHEGNGPGESEFSAVFTTLYCELYRIACSWTHDVGEAEDVVSATFFAKAWQYRHSFKDDGRSLEPSQAA